MWYATIVFCFFGNVAPYVLKPGPCPVLETMKDFDINKYLGGWWIVAHSIVYSHGMDKCTYQFYTPIDNGTVFSVGTSIDRNTGVETATPTTLYIGDPAESSKMTQVNYELSWRGIYWILHTDYDSYAVVYQCQNVQLRRLEQVFFFSREQKPPKSVFDKLDEIIEQYNISKKIFGRVKQDDCVLRPS